MQRLAIGVTVAAAIWLGGALAAEAQVIIEPTGPLAVTNTDTSSTYTANVTAPSDFWVWLRVYLNGTLKHDTKTRITWSGGTYSFSKLVDMANWGHQVGDTLLYRGKAWLASNMGMNDQEDWTILVTQGITYAEPPRSRASSELVVADRDRRTWA